MMQKISKRKLLNTLVQEEREVRVKFSDETFQGKVEYREDCSQPGYYIGNRQIKLNKIKSPIRKYNSRILELELAN